MKFRSLLIALILTSAMVCLAAGGCSKRKDLPNIILISIDTLRADHLSCYGYNKKTSPMIDQLAKKGVKFTNAYATSPWTLPSHGSMFTGFYPSKHNAVDEAIALDKQIPLLTERLKKAGYLTGGFVSHYYLSRDYGFDRGFDKYITRLEAPAEKVTDTAIKWIRDNRKKSFFAFIHLFDPHTPYQPPPEFARKYYPPDMAAIAGGTKDVLSVIHSGDEAQRQKTITALKALYDGEIEYTDSVLGKFYQKLQLFKLDKNTLIIIVSDHGEEFFEHGLMEHGFTFYQEQLRIPLIFYAPDKIAQSRVVDTPVSLIDLAPTLLEYAGLQAPQGIDGMSLMPFISKPIQGAPEPEIPAVFKQRSLHAQTTRQGPDRMCMIKNDKKYVYSPEFKLSFKQIGPEFFDLAVDPGEKNNLLDQQEQLVNSYHQEMIGTGMYAPRKVWHVLFGPTKKQTIYNGGVSTINRIISAYKENVVYDVDPDGEIVALEFPMKRADSGIRFVGFGQDGLNGFSFIPDPQNAKFNFLMFVDEKERPDKVNIGKLGNHPEQIPFSLDRDVPKEADAPPPGEYLVWSSTEYTNANVVARFEVGDQVKPSQEMKERLRSLGYIGGGQ